MTLTHRHTNRRGGDGRNVEEADEDIQAEGGGGVSEWISVENKLPQERGHYLVMLKTDGNIGFEVHEHLIRIMYFGSEGWRLPRHYPEWIHEALKQEVTHWMPLPEPPKEQKNRIKDHVCNNDYCELE